MQLDPDYAKDLIINMRSLTRQFIQPDSVLFPMIKLLQNKISKEDRNHLVKMMKHVANIDGPIEPEQTNFIRCFEDRMGIGG